MVGKKRNENKNKFRREKLKIVGKPVGKFNFAETLWNSKLYTKVYNGGEKIMIRRSEALLKEVCEQREHLHGYTRTHPYIHPNIQGCWQLGGVYQTYTSSQSDCWQF